MATRYSGNLRIVCTYQDRGDYKCTVTPHGGRARTVYVGPPASGYGPGIGYDSPQAYDQVAHAAISFADDEESGIAEGAEYTSDLSGYKIHRSLPSYSPFVRTAEQVGAVRAQRAAGKAKRLEKEAAAEVRRKAERDARELKEGSFLVRTTTGGSRRFWEIRQANDWAGDQIKGRPGAVAEIFNLSGLRAQDTHPHPVSALEANEYGVVHHVGTYGPGYQVKTGGGGARGRRGGGGANMVGPNMSYYAARDSVAAGLDHFMPGGGGARAGSTSKSPIVGRRVEIHPGHDLWMRGARFGEVNSVSKDGRIAYVRMDHPRVRKLAGILVTDLTFEGGPSPGAGWTKAPSGRWTWERP